MLLSCPSTGTTARASSILNRNSKLYGPKNALETTNTSSCWNSDAAPSGGDSSISYIVDFGRTVEVTELRIQFQGGFVGEECIVSSGPSRGVQKTGWNELDVSVDPEDTNALQEFDLTAVPPAQRTCGTLKIEFESSTDFYGRVTIYRFEVWGREIEDT